jgi:hypothetical protein
VRAALRRPKAKQWSAQFLAPSCFSRLIVIHLSWAEAFAVFVTLCIRRGNNIKWVLPAQLIDGLRRLLQPTGWAALLGATAWFEQAAALLAEAQLAALLPRNVCIHLRHVRSAEPKLTTCHARAVQAVQRCAVWLDAWKRTCVELR